jgi:hypothetical protein
MSENNDRQTEETPQLESQTSEPSVNGTSDPREMLKRDLASTRLPPDVKEEILAKSPSPEEYERLLRELQENGGLSSEEFLASLGLGVEPRP